MYKKMKKIITPTICIMAYVEIPRWNSQLHMIWGRPQFQYYTEYNDSETAATPNDKNTESRFI